MIVDFRLKLLFLGDLPADEGDEMQLYEGIAFVSPRRPVGYLVFRMRI